MAAGPALRRSWQAAPATMTLVAVTALVWVLALAAQWSGAMVLHASFLPERLMGLPGDDLLIPPWLTPLTTLFVHAGFLHLALNLIALVLFGRAVEPAAGTVGLLLLYVVGAFTAAGAYYLVHPIALPWIGAGGGVGAVLGAYAMLFGRNRVKSKARSARWAYALWLCVGWTLLSLLVTVAFADAWAIYYAVSTIASFAVGMPLGRLLLLFRYRKA